MNLKSGPFFVKSISFLDYFSDQHDGFALSDRVAAWRREHRCRFRRRGPEAGGGHVALKVLSEKLTSMAMREIRATLDELDRGLVA
jgi:hypothetical protein